MLTRVEFTPARKARVNLELAGAVDRVSRAVNREVEFVHTPIGPFDPAPFRPGWRLIGLSMAWRVEAAVQQGDWRKAVNQAVTAVRFGVALCGGAAADVSLGTRIAQDARRVIAPHLPAMPPEELRRLAAGMQQALEDMPEISQSLEFEKANMMVAVQLVQDAYRDRNFTELREQLGRVADPAVVYLERMPDHQRPAYFVGMAEEAQHEVEQVLRAAAQLPSEREKFDGMPVDYRPWRRFAAHFFHTVRPLPHMRDRMTAWTRLLALQALLTANVLEGKPLPATLAGFPVSLRIDPYSGEPFVYRTAGTAFQLYSVGANGVDDGGETNDPGESPDLVAENQIG